MWPKTNGYVLKNNNNDMLPIFINVVKRKI